MTKGIAPMDELSLFTLALGVSKPWQVVDLKFSNRNDTAHSAFSSAQNRLNASNKFTRTKGLCHVVVSAKLQSFNFVIHGIKSSKKEHRRLFAALPERGNDIPAILVRQHNIENYEHVIAREG